MKLQPYLDHLLTSDLWRRKVLERDFAGLEDMVVATVTAVKCDAVREEREGLRVFVKEAAVGVRRDPHGQGWCEALDLIEEWIRRRGTP